MVSQEGLPDKTEEAEKGDRQHVAEEARSFGADVTEAAREAEGGDVPGDAAEDKGERPDDREEPEVVLLDEAGDPRERVEEDAVCADCEEHRHKVLAPERGEQEEGERVAQAALGT
jgi:hypothetical protein